MNEKASFGLTIAAKYAQVEEGRSGFYWCLCGCVPSLPMNPLELIWAKLKVSPGVSKSSGCVFTVCGVVIPDILCFLPFRPCLSAIY